ncbi:transmembrane family of transporters domain-containing protein [Ditylenchus destructor]|uniref:Transmembrane family of transporters domain-containing protein n=1 Tax=Ditylenchus destructor TaxID=166010 RepID=A0AAD4NKP2_9BILA|nr:transmembrane family of transporters domain-containing protein [Ditylenchus destructor]
MDRLANRLSKFHATDVTLWTGLACSCYYFIYHGGHKKPSYQRLLLEKSSILNKESFSDRIEEQLYHASERRMRPLTSVKFTTAITDNIESDTAGCFASSTTGAMFRVTSRLLVDDVAELRKCFPDLAVVERRAAHSVLAAKLSWLPLPFINFICSLLPKNSPDSRPIASKLMQSLRDMRNGISVDCSQIDDEALSKVLFSEDAKNFILTRLILQGDSLSILMKPVFACISSFIPAYGIAFFLQPYVGAVLAVLVALIAGAVLWNYIRKGLLDSFAFKFDIKVASINDSYAKGFRDYIKANMEFGKLMYQYGGPAAQKLFDEDGNYLVQIPSYSRRLGRMFYSKFASLRQSFSLARLKQALAKADEYMESKKGIKVQLYAFSGGVFAVPLGLLIFNGPLLKLTFPWRHKVDYDLPPHLKSIIDEKFREWTRIEDKKPKEVLVDFSCQKGADKSLDTVSSGSSYTRFGAQIALPFYARFENEEEAYDYCKKHFEPFNVLGKTACIVWESELGKELISSMVLSKKTLYFLVMRALYRNMDWNAYINGVISLVMYTFVLSIIVLVAFHYVKRHHTLSFIGLYLATFPLTIAMAWQYHLGYVWALEFETDRKAVDMSPEYLEGAKEFYLKYFQRNKILKDLVEGGDKLFTQVGSTRGDVASHQKRYEALKGYVVKGKKAPKEWMSVLLGLAACALSSVCFGSMYVAVRKFEAGDGIFVQWVLSPIPTIGNARWTSLVFRELNCFADYQNSWPWNGNFDFVNCVVGWAAGRFGLFGIKASVPSSPTVNYIGLCFVIIGGALFSIVRPSVKKESEKNIHDLNSPVVENNERSSLMGDAAADETVDRTPALPQSNALGAYKLRITAICLSIFAGICYGLTFVPVIYIQDNPEYFVNPPKDAVYYAFSHFSGIYITSTAVLLVYLFYTKNSPFVNGKIILPSFLAGLLWAIAQLAWFLANDLLSQAITFPINAMMPGVCAALWSVFYFKEIKGAKNLRLLVAAVLITVTGAALVGISKSL